MGSERAQLVAVGVDATGATIGAARYAAEVAGHRGWDLMLVHSRQDEDGAGAPTQTEPRTTGRAAEAVVDDVLSALQLGSSTRVHRVVTPASAADALCQISRYVSLLVLGQRVDPADPLLRGRVGAAVAAGAHCPVVQVPPGWSSDGSAGRPVVVALDGACPSEVALRFAFEEAADLGTGVLAMLGVAGERKAPFLTEERASLSALLAKVEQDHPAVEVRTVVVHGAVRTDSVGESVAAAQVVVGRPRPDREDGTWSRLLAGAVATGSSCPVLIAPAEDVDATATAGAARAYLGRGGPGRTPALPLPTQVGRPGSQGSTHDPDPVPLSRRTSGRRPSWWPAGRRKRRSPDSLTDSRNVEEPFDRLRERG